MFSIWQYSDNAYFISRSFRYLLLFASLPRFVVLLRCSVSMELNRQIIVPANVNQIIIKNQFFHYEQNIVTNVNYGISAHPY